MPAADDDVEEDARGEPERAGDARARMRPERDDHHRRREDEADDREDGDDGAADPDAAGHAERATQLGLREPEPDHGELRGAERDEDAEAVERRERHDRVVAQHVDRDERDRRDGAGRDERLRRDERAPVQAAERPRQLVVLAERVREPAEAGDRGRRRRQEDQHAGEADVDAQGVAEHGREIRREHLDDPHQRRTHPVAAERVLVALGREGGERDEPDRGVDRHREPDRGEQAPRQGAARPPRLLGEVRDRLEAGVGEERERQREGDRVPRRRDPEVGPRLERVPRVDQGEPEPHEQDLRAEVDDGDRDHGAIQAGAVQQPVRHDRRDREHRDGRVPRALAQRVDPERGAEVVRHEQRRQRDHDHVVEEERPAGDEAGEVVERLPDEGGGAAGLADRGRALDVRERDDHEVDAGAEQHRRREAERVDRDDAEREVDRRRDLPVRDREERGRVDHPLEPRQLARHARVSLAPELEVQAAGAGEREQRPEEEPDAAAARRREDGHHDPDARPARPRGRASRARTPASGGRPRRGDHAPGTARASGRSRRSRRRSPSRAARAEARP